MSLPSTENEWQPSLCSPGTLSLESRQLGLWYRFRKEASWFVTASGIQATPPYWLLKESWVLVGLLITSLNRYYSLFHQHERPCWITERQRLPHQNSGRTAASYPKPDIIGFCSIFKSHRALCEQSVYTSRRIVEYRICDYLCKTAGSEDSSTVYDRFVLPVPTHKEV